MKSDIRQAKRRRTKKGDKVAHIDITVMVRHVTERAVLVDHGDKEPVWLPLAQCELASTAGFPAGNGGTHTLSLPEWLAREKGLI